MPLTPQEIDEVKRLAGHYQDKSAASVEALRAVQRTHHWISDELLEEVAGLLEMTRDELDSVATFYNLIFRRPVGRHVVLICDSVSCWMLGCDGLRSHLEASLGTRMGATTSDGRFTLLPIVCLGACDRAPVLMIDDDLHTNLDPGKLDAILEKYP